MLEILIPMGIFVIVMSIVVIHKLHGHDTKLNRIFEYQSDLFNSPLYWRKNDGSMSKYSPSYLAEEWNHADQRINGTMEDLTVLEKKLEAHKNGLKYCAEINGYHYYYNREHNGVVYYNHNTTDGFAEEGFIRATNLNLLEEN